MTTVHPPIAESLLFVFTGTAVTEPEISFHMLSEAIQKEEAELIPCLEGVITAIVSMCLNGIIEQLAIGRVSDSDKVTPWTRAQIKTAEAALAKCEKKAEARLKALLIPKANETVAHTCAAMAAAVTFLWGLFSESYPTIYKAVMTPEPTQKLIEPPKPGDIA